MDINDSKRYAPKVDQNTVLRREDQQVELDSTIVAKDVEAAEKVAEAVDAALSASKFVVYANEDPFATTVAPYDATVTTAIAALFTEEGATGTANTDKSAIKLTLASGLLKPTDVYARIVEAIEGGEIAELVGASVDHVDPWLQQADKA